MSIFNDIGNLIGGVVGSTIPGFDTLAQTGIFGSTLAASAGAPGTAPATVEETRVAAVAGQTLTKLTGTTIGQPTGGAAGPAVVAGAAVPVSPAAAAAGAVAAVTDPGPLVGVPRNFIVALVADNRDLKARYVPPTALVAAAQTTPTSPVSQILAGLPNIISGLF